MTPAQLGGLRREVRRTPSRTSRPTSACANEAVSSRGHTAGHNPLLSSSICLRPNGLGYLADSVVACLGKPQGFTVTTSDGVKLSWSCGPDRRRSPALPDQIIGHSVQIMSIVTLIEFRSHASGMLDRVERGETLVLLRHGRPIAEVSPVAASAARSEPPQPALTRVGEDLRAEQVGHRRIRQMRVVEARQGFSDRRIPRLARGDVDRCA